MTPSTENVPDFDPAAVRDKYAAGARQAHDRDRGVLYDLKHRRAVRRAYTRDPHTPFVERDPVATEVDVAIIGAGMSGVVVGAKLRDAGLAHDHADRQGRRHRRHLVLEPLPGRDVRRRVLHLHADARGDELRPDDAVRVRGRDPPAPRRDRDEVRPGRRRAVPHRRRDQRVGREQLALGDPHRSRRRGARPLPHPGARDPQPHEAARRSRAWTTSRARRSTPPGGTTSTPAAGPTTRTSPSSPTRSSASSAWARAGSRRCRRWRSRRSTCTCSSARRRRSACEGTGPPTSEFAEHLRPGWQRERMENFSAVMIGRPVETDLVDDGWTLHTARLNNPVIEPGHGSRRHRATWSRSSTTRSWRSTASGSRRSSPIRPSPRCSSRTTATGASGPASTTSTSPRSTTPTSRWSTVPAGVDAHHRARRDRQRHRVRARLHRLRHRLRGRAHTVPAPRRAHHHRP